MPFKRKNIVLRSIDLCEDGANPDSHILLCKSKNKGGQKNVNSNENNSKGGENMKLEDILKALPEDQQGVLKQELSTKEDKIKELNDKLDKVKKEKEKPEDKDSDDKPEDIIKEADPKIKELFDKMSEKIEKSDKEKSEIKKELDKVVKERKQEKFKKIAKTYDKIPLDTDEFGDILMKVAENLSEDEFDKIKEAFNKANSIAKADKVLEEVGSGMSSEEDNTADTTLKAKTKEIKKSNPDLTDEQAERQALRDNPDLYEKLSTKEV